MNLHLEEISAAVAPGAHAVLIVDQAGWHMTAKLKTPANIAILPLPAKAPELNPAENVWQFLRENYLSNRVFVTVPLPEGRCKLELSSVAAGTPRPRKRAPAAKSDRFQRPGAIFSRLEGLLKVY
jgi:hypothetical protein